MSDNILQAIDNLTAAMVGLTAAQNNQNIILTATATSSCSCVVGSAPDGEGGEEGGDPPPPIGEIIYDYPDPEIDSRKCKAADYLVDWLVDEIFRDILVAHNIKQLTGVGLALALGTVGALVGSSAGLAGSVIGGIAGLLIGAIAALFDVNLDVEQIESVMQGVKQDLICALYNATSVDDARADFQQVLEDTAQLSSAEIAFTMLWLPNALLNVLFFEITTPIDSAAFFDGYEPVIGCDACGPALTDWILLPSGAFAGVTTATGFVGSGTILQDGTQFTLSSVEKTNEPGTHAIAMIVSGFLAAQGSDNLFQTDPTGTDGGQITRQSNGSGINVLHGRTAVGCAHGVTQPSTASAPATDNNFQFVYYQANNSFTLDFTIDTPPDPC